MGGKESRNLFDFVEKNKVVKKSVSTEELIARIDKKIQEIEELESKEGQ